MCTFMSIYQTRNVDVDDNVVPTTTTSDDNDDDDDKDTALSLAGSSC